MSNRAQFYQNYRRLFENKLDQGQVSGMEATLNYHQGIYPNEPGLPYVLATFYHETGRTMLPVREGFAKSNEQAIRIVTRMYEQGRISKNYALPDPETGQSYYGRGLCQTTWKHNYRKLGNIIFHDPELFVKNPDLLLDLNTSVETSIEAMYRGLYTGKKISDYITQDKKDYYNARRIVNGLDKASLIAGYAVKFERCLKEVSIL